MTEHTQGLAELFKPVNIVLREDVESLRRLSYEERVALFNTIQEGYKRYLFEVSHTIESRKADQKIRGKFMLAQLLLAATFRVNGEEAPDITRRFSEEEYKVILDLEDLKILDLLDVDEIVEFIERREGKVYEVVKNYYERQYYLLDTKWGKLMGTLALVLNERYKERRRKLEDAVVAYMRKRPLTIFIGEIEDAVLKAVEARRTREEAEKLSRRLEEEFRKLEAMAGLTPHENLEEQLASLENALSRARELGAMLEALERARRALEEKEEELRGLAAKYKEAEAAEEVLRAEADRLRAQIGELHEKLREYQDLLATLKAERDALRERLEILEASMRGQSEGHLVTAEEAWALEESLIHRVLRRAGKEAIIYDPRRGEKRRIAWDRKSFYQLEADLKPRGLGVELVSLRGALRRRPDVLLNASNIVHADAYKEMGFDSKPVGLGEVLEHLEPRLQKASGEGVYAIIIIGSPTGFSQRAVEYVVGGKLPGLAPDTATVYLVDPVTGKVYYNLDDPAAQANKSLAEPWLEEEKLGRVLRFLRSKEAMEKALVNSPASPFLTSTEVAEATGLDLETIRRAFQKLEEEGLGRVSVIEGRTAFIYKRR